MISINELLAYKQKVEQEMVMATAKLTVVNDLIAAEQSKEAENTDTESSSYEGNAIEQDASEVSQDETY